MIHRAQFARLVEPCPNCGYSIQDILRPVIGYEGAYAVRPQTDTTTALCVKCHSRRNVKLIKIGPLPCPPFKYPYGWSRLECWEFDEAPAEDVPPEILQNLNSIR